MLGQGRKISKRHFVHFTTPQSTPRQFQIQRQLLHFQETELKRRPSLEQFPPTSTERQLSTRSLWFKSHVWRQLAKNESRDVEEQVLPSPTMRLCYWRPLAVFEFHSIHYIGYINEDPVHYIRIECWACWSKINLINRNLFVPGIRKEIVQENSFFTYDEFTENSQGNEL